MSAMDFLLRGLTEHRAREAAAILSLDGAPEATLAQASRDATVRARIRALSAAGVISIDSSGVCRIDLGQLAAVQRRRVIRLFVLFAIIVLALLLPVGLALFASMRR